MERAGRAGAAEQAGGNPFFLAMKRAACAFYVAQIIPAVMGLKAAAAATADVL